MKTFVAFILRNPNFDGEAFLMLLALASGDYDQVTLEANDFNDVYEKLNHGSGRELRGYTGRSLSVGDMIIDSATRDMVMVSKMGFEPL